MVDYHVYGLKTLFTLLTFMRDFKQVIFEERHEVVLLSEVRALFEQLGT